MNRETFFASILIAALVVPLTSATPVDQGLADQDVVDAEYGSMPDLEGPQSSSDYTRCRQLTPEPTIENFDAGDYKEKTWYGFEGTLYLSWTGKAYQPIWDPSDPCGTNNHLTGFSYVVVNEGSSTQPDCVQDSGVYGSGGSGLVDFTIPSWSAQVLKVRALDKFEQCGPVKTFTFYNDHIAPTVTRVEPRNGEITNDALQAVTIEYADTDNGNDPKQRTKVDPSWTKMFIDSSTPRTLAYATAGAAKYVPDSQWSEGWHYIAAQIGDEAEYGSRCCWAGPNVVQYGEPYAGKAMSAFYVDCLGDGGRLYDTIPQSPEDASFGAPLLHPIDLHEKNAIGAGGEPDWLWGPIQDAQSLPGDTLRGLPTKDFFLEADGLPTKRDAWENVCVI